MSAVVRDHPPQHDRSIEKDPTAREIRRLRAFFRQFPPSDRPEQYYEYLRGETDRMTCWTTWSAATLLGDAAPHAFETQSG